jgi:DNA-binding NarL/FixJ family response regulator
MPPMQRRLTATEARLARLVASGSTDGQIASQLGLEPEAIGRHLAQVYRKLDVWSRAELALLIGSKQEELA